MKIVKLLILAAVPLCIAGCTTAYTPTGFTTPRGGYLFTGTTYPSAITQPDNLPEYKIIRKVKGQGSQTSILSLVSFGDGGIIGIKRELLDEVDGADDIINLTVDTKVFSVLYMFTTCITEIEGDAIKYKK